MSFDSLADIKTEVKALLKDPNGRIISDDEIVDWWYEAEKKYARATGYFRKIDRSLATIEGVREITLPSDFIRPVAVHLMDPELTTEVVDDDHTWDTEPEVVLANNTLVEETFTLAVKARNLDDEMLPAGFVISVTGDVSGAQATDYTCDGSSTDYTTVSNSGGIGAGLKFAFNYLALWMNAAAVGTTLATIAIELNMDELEQTDVKDLDAAYSGWRTEIDEPSKYYISQNKLGFYPSPDDIYGLQTEYENLPTKQEDDEDEPNVPPQDREDLINWVLYKAFYKARQFEKSALYKEMFRYDVDQASVFLRMRKDRPARITYRYKHGWRRG